MKKIILLLIMITAVAIGFHAQGLAAEKRAMCLKAAPSVLLTIQQPSNGAGIRLRAPIGAHSGNYKASNVGFKANFIKMSTLK